MYIKQVIVEGFKSYREQVAIEPFSPKHNVIVGANGSGKTNFFHAIRFVLSDFTTQMRQEERQRLLHDGAGVGSVLSAYVEIVFDNSDNRLPIDRETVRLRRSIGLKKDEYFLDRKHITKPEVMNLLESAGFSRSNPYYVVQQGKIQALTTMRDTERLELLKEIGGTKVYDERRKESLKIMQETETRQVQIEETIKYIDDRLAELNEEREELVKYQEVDRKRRSLEYTIFEKELSDTRAKLEEVETARQRASEKSNKVHAEARTAHSEQKEVEKSLKQAEHILATLLKEKKQLEETKKEDIKRRAQVELDVKDIEERLQVEHQGLEERKNELVQIEREMVQTQQALQQIRPIYNEKVQQEESTTSRIHDCEHRLAALYKKQGRSSQYKSQGEKDSAVKKEISERTAILHKKMEAIKRLEAEIQELNSSIMDRSTESDTSHERQEQLTKSLEASSATLAEAKAKRDELQNRRQANWKLEEEKEAELEKMQQDMRKKEKHMEAAVPRDINRGLTNVKRICSDHRIPGVHGPLIELFDCDEKFNTAVEVTAGNTLFHIVVDTDEISTKIIHYLNIEKGGRVSFLPLNQLKAKEQPYPNTPDAIPLLSRLKYNPKYHAAFYQIFGKVLLCRSLDVATNMSRSTKLDCVTMEGDQVNKRGALTGGYHDLRYSRLSYMKSIKELGGKINAAREEAQGFKAENQQVEQEVNRVMTQLEKINNERARAKSELDRLRAEVADIGDKGKYLQAQLEAKERLLRSAQDSTARMQKQIEELQEELKVDFMAALTPEQREELAGLNPEIQRLKTEQVRCQAERMEQETQKTKLELHLERNLERRKLDVEAELESMNLDTRREQMKARHADLQQVAESLNAMTASFQENERKVQEQRVALQQFKAQLDELKAVQEAEEQLLQEEAKEMEQLMGKRNLLLQKREDLQKKIRELGSLPSNAFDKYKGKAAKELHRMLQQCNEAFKKFSHVNKKALDQFLQFTEQREDLNRRQAEVEKSKDKIRELIEGLDRKKDEDIERTFRGVAMHFKEIFNEIVVKGKGELVMIKNKDQPVADGTVPDSANLERSVEKYHAVQVRVSFGAGEAKTMKQLSGGQKAVVALSLIFSIQRVDPAPFYLFDEIDAALDAQYRAAVGNMIYKQAQAHTQFVTTTFRPELVKVCSKVYGVTHKNRVSCVEVISKEDALGFIEDFN
mmetsp:Transcript_30826/g.67303  ORF Transcript_30826/g.67303 Transcript_30826/m.67303 type:complete len:1195 (-) Transcript_30826:298-3882(-)|eukprot:CAMPEP_0118946156 /NCGR_PEP_ID=MMETSP1169-20130426/43672_1 /TAXON_ID=36882 /ORGANISM="Pyramimonas obovata, Strain CCMP722" /LENGTH=1194 /DNA_ID=CAMNT_0006892057 /DNA_START=124 /DNA_END=3708 /DNA_ORIENTATION=-